jgi:HSP20 family protein
MALMRWNDPFRELSTVHQGLDNLLSSFLNDSAPGGVDNAPNMDVYIEDDNRLVAELHLPGFTPEDVEIRVQDGALEIRGERQESIEDEDKSRRGYLVRQSVERFFRRIMLPNDVDKDNVQASFEDGVLRVVVPFTEERESKKIAIGSGNSKRGKKETTSSRTTKSKS